MVLGDARARASVATSEEDARARVALATTVEDARADLEKGPIKKPPVPKAAKKKQWWSFKATVAAFEEFIMNMLMSKEDKRRLANCSASTAELVAQYESPELAHLSGFQKLKKVHLIAPLEHVYDPSKPLTTLVSYRGTSLDLILQRPDFWLLLIFHIVMSAIYFGLGNKETSGNPTTSGWPQVNTSMLTIIGSLLAFVIVFFLNQTYARYYAQFAQVRAAGNVLLEVVGHLRVLMWDDAFPGARIVRHELTKLLNVLLILAYASLPTMKKNKVHEWAWWYFVSNNFLTPAQVAQLKPLQSIGSGNVVFKEVLVWVHRGVWAQVSKKHMMSRAGQMISLKLWEIRKNLDGLYSLVSGPLPFAYYHLVNFIILGYLFLLAYAFVFVAAYWSIPCYALILVGFLGLRELGNAMSNPLGHDSTDIPIFFFAEGFLLRSIAWVNMDSHYPDELEPLRPADWEFPMAAMLEGAQADDEQEGGIGASEFSAI